MPTARHIVLIYSDQMRLEHYAWMSDGWRLSVLTSPERVLTLDAVEFSISLGQIYFDLSF